MVKSLCGGDGEYDHQRKTSVIVFNDDIQRTEAEKINIKKK